MQKRTEILPSGLSFDLILVEGGEFIMGSHNDDPVALAREKPAHCVKVSDFFLGQYPVTQALWEAVMGTNPAYFEGPNRPVEQVSWYDAVAFCNRLSLELGLPLCYYSDAGFADPYSISGSLTNEGPVFLNPKAGGFRLPTEAEWEYAARGGIYSQVYRYAGSDRLKHVGWYDDNSGNETHEVGLLYPNELRFYDMSGNVWEWCEDQWYDNYQDAPKNGGAWVDQEQGAFCVIRGGSWYFSAQHYCCVASRHNHDPGASSDVVGFRVALFLQSVG